MPFLIDIPDLVNPTAAEIQDRFDRYYLYLNSIGPSLPESARSFATAPWHYDYSNPMCPHDAWVEQLSIDEVGYGSGNVERAMRIVVTALGAYHDGKIRIVYDDVSEYDLACASGGSAGPARHGDWLYDEVGLTPSGKVVHEVRFARAARWRIVCGDMSYEWMRFEK